ncbi:MAG: sulfatase [Muribaculaceae bacterium]|nr:sulfatase [Muribaculaceae bacterium]
MKLNNIFRTAAVGASLAAAAGAVAQQRPNIIFFLVDDFGWSETSLPFGADTCANNRMFHTPNMERLARRGTMLTNAYACSVSTPTRTCLMTGMNPAHMGITSFISLYKDIVPDAIGGHPGSTNENLDDIFAHPEWNHNALCPAHLEGEKEIYGLNHTLFATPLPQLLRDSGYHTIHVGKAHWGPAGTPGSNPYNMGFVVNIAGASNGHPKSYLPEENFGNLPGKGDYGSVMNMSQYYGTGVHLTDAITREALRTLDHPLRQQIPFFLYFAHYTNHTPIQRDVRFYQKYIDAGLDEGQARYASMVEGMDKSLGDVLDFIDERGIGDNTVLIFYSDNGGHSVGGEKGGQMHTQNLPLREGKGSVYEGGIRVPMMVCWPGKVAPDTRINTPVCTEDFFPTFLELAQVNDAKTVQTTDGQSLVKLFTDGSEYAAAARDRGQVRNQAEATALRIPQSVSGLADGRPLVFHFPHQLRFEDQEDIDFMSALRKDDWKLVYRMHTGELELYNLADDIGEHNNLAARYPERVRSMAGELGEKLRGWKACMPTVRATGKPVPLPDEL